MPAAVRRWQVLTAWHLCIRRIKHRARTDVCVHFGGRRVGIVAIQISEGAGAARDMAQYL